MNAKANTAMNRQDFEQALRDKGAYYHIHHPYHRAMYSGQCTPEQIRGWVANRYYYQVRIPQKDAAIMSNCPDAGVRRLWLQRILDHDGHEGDVGGIEAWLTLAERSEEHTSELQSRPHLVCRLLLEKKKSNSCQVYFERVMLLLSLYELVDYSLS